MKRSSSILAILFVLGVGLVFADSASAAGGLRRGRSSCDCACASEPACGAAEPACAAAEPACCAAEPACGAAAPACCSAEPRRRGLRSRLASRRSNDCGSGCTSCCAEPACSAEPACNAG
ncbi:MAG: hypothetical protein EBR28_12055 [Planctomycetia bacterium]|nr:hypothetical protein [Planctomycetia bacterium]